MRRRQAGGRDPEALREARCRWYYDRRRVPDEAVAVWQEEHPHPGGYGDVTVRLLAEQANCRCRWCAAALSDIDPREWLDAGEVRR